MQYQAEQVLVRQVNTTGAVGGQIIVMDTDTGDIIAMSPPLIIEKGEIDFLIGKLADVLKTIQ